MIIAPLVAAVLLTAQAPPAAARFRSYGFASTTLSIHPGTGEPYHRVQDRLNGHTWTIAGGAGVFLTPSLGLEGEFVYAGTVSAPQEFHYDFSEQYTATNRDILINELLRVRPGGDARVQYVLGGGYAHTRTQQTSLVEIDPYGKRTAVGDFPVWSYNGLTLTGGMDALFSAGPHALIGPTVRVRWLHRPTGGETGWNGIGNLALQVGASVFFR